MIQDNTSFNDRTTYRKWKMKESDEYVIYEYFNFISQR